MKKTLEITLRIAVEAVDDEYTNIETGDVDEYSPYELAEVANYMVTSPDAIEQGFAGSGIFATFTNSEIVSARWTS